MQKLTSFLEKSVQWVALGVAGVFLLLCVYWYLLTPIATVKVAGKPVAPGEIDQMTQNGPIAEISNDIKRGKTEAIVPQDMLGPWKTELAKASSTPFPSLVINAPTDRIIESGPNDGPRPGLVGTVAELPKATPLSVQAGMSVAAPLKGPAGQEVQGAVASDLLWASVAYKVSADELKAAFAKPLDKKDPDFARFYRTAYLAIELQRQQAIGHDASGSPVFADDNNTFTRVEVAKVDQGDWQPLPDDKSPVETKSSFAQWADANELNVRQPKFYTIVGGSQYAPAVLTAAPAAAPGAAAGAAATPAAPAPIRPPVAAPAAPNNLLGAAGNAKQPGIDPTALSGDQLIWAHDDTVVAGRSYRYRIVYHLKNPVFGLFNIADPKIINQLDIASPPSDWSAPITIPKNVEYWVTALPRSGGAQIDYFKWSGGSWKETKAMSVSAGDTIPDTDQTIVDIHNASSPRPKEQYVLLTDSVGEPIRHVAKEDREDSRLKEFLKSASPDAAPAAGAGGPAPIPPRNAAGGGAPAPIPPRTGAGAPRGNR